MTEPPEANVGLWQIVVAVCVFIVGAISASIGGAWTARGALEKSRDALADKIDVTRRELEKKIDADAASAQKLFSDSLGAFREKMTDMELWNRDTFVRKDTFTLVMAEFKEGWHRFEDQVYKRFDKIDKKLDEGDH